MNASTSQENQPGARPLRRPIDGRILGGVASGLASRFALDVAIIRIAFVMLSLLGGAGVPLYLAAWILIPAAGSGRTLADEMRSQAGRQLGRPQPPAG